MGEMLNRWLAVWLRNALVWRKSLKTALLGGFAEPLFYLLALGYGLGSFIGKVDGITYMGFLASGIVASSAMNAATFEGLYLAYTRMEVQRTWDGMLAAPLGITDIVIGELLWMASKSLISASLILTVVWLLGYANDWTAIGVLPVAFLEGLCFGSMALLVTAFARGYDFFVYYITLGITPMVLLSGVYFPFLALPDSIRSTIKALPLFHIVEIIRPLLGGTFEAHMLFHLLVPTAFTIIATFILIWKLKRRLLQ